MAESITVTGKIGPGSTLTAVVYTGVSEHTIDCVANILTMVINGLRRAIDITAATTITATKSGSTYTLVVS